MNRLPSVTLEQLLSKRGNRLPLLEALYVGYELAKRVDGRHRMGLGVGDLDVDRVLVDEEGGVGLGGGARGPHDVKKDVFALGRVLYELVTGASVAEVLAVQVRSPGARLPAPSRFNPAIDSELDALLVSAVASDEAQRPSSVRVLQVAIEAAFEELDLPIVPGGLLDDVAQALPSASAATESELPLNEVVEAILDGKGPASPVYATPTPLPVLAPVAAPPPPPAAALAEAPVVAHVLTRAAPAPAPKPAPRAAAPRPTRRPPTWWSEPAEDVVTEEAELFEEFEEREARPPESSAAWTLLAAALSVVAVAWTFVL